MKSKITIAASVLVLLAATAWAGTNAVKRVKLPAAVEVAPAAPAQSVPEATPVDGGTMVADALAPVVIDLSQWIVVEAADKAAVEGDGKTATLAEAAANANPGIVVAIDASGVIAFDADTVALIEEAVRQATASAAPLTAAETAKVQAIVDAVKAAMERSAAAASEIASGSATAISGTGAISGGTATGTVTILPIDASAIAFNPTAGAIGSSAQRMDASASAITTVGSIEIKGIDPAAAIAISAANAAMVAAIESGVGANGAKAMATSLSISIPAFANIRPMEFSRAWAIKVQAMQIAKSGGDTTALESAFWKLMANAMRDQIQDELIEEAVTNGTYKIGDFQ